MRNILATCGVLYLLAPPLQADLVSFTGVINQSVQDGTGPAANNPAINSILDGDVYRVTVNFTGSISSTGTYALTGASATFLDVTQSVTETMFAPDPASSCGVISAICLVVTPDGAFDDISVLACLSSGSGCSAGNQLDALFKIPSGSLIGTNISAQSIFGLTPMDLLEDDGVTDIKGTVTTWSNNSVSAVPEPSTIWVLASLLAPLAWIRKRRINQ